MTKYNASRTAYDYYRRNVCWIISQLGDCKNSGPGGLPAKTAKGRKHKEADSTALHIFIFSSSCRRNKDTIWCVNIKKCTLSFASETSCMDICLSIITTNSQIQRYRFTTKQL